MDARRHGEGGATYWAGGAGATKKDAVQRLVAVLLAKLRLARGHGHRRDPLAAAGDL
jgi:hypothetical protein